MGNAYQVLLEPAKAVLARMGQFALDLILVVVILIVGWLVAKVVKAVVTKGLRAIKMDDLSARIELEDILAKGGISYSFSELIGVAVYWVGILVTFVVASNAVNLTIVADLLKQVVAYMPLVIAAIFIVILGMFVATLSKNFVQTTASNAGLSQSKFLSRVVEVIVMIFALAITLEQLNIGAKLIELIIGITLASLGLGLALAFGLGCREIAARFTNELIEKLKAKK